MTREDSEKRFHSVMDKLFYAPKLTRSSGNEYARGQKRGNSSMNVLVAKSSNSGGNIMAGGGSKCCVNPVGSSSSSEAPLCRPWDRGDLIRRLATFKSMTWFGKPKVVSAVNCARRGWINVEMDIIACEACGARLLFSTPSSWTQQQIEKAAAVFSLKLDGGHKLLCPWIDNVCDESLIQFPPTPIPALVDGFKERYSTLLQLSALPMISSSAIDFMRNLQLEHFLKQSSTLEFGLGSADAYRTECLGIEHEAVSANLYYQALKLISLCGWEPHSLPYAVDCENQLSTQSANTIPRESSSQIVNGQNPGIVTYLTSGDDQVREVDEDYSSFGRQQSDPASVVLDCRLCGASVGLWAFSTVQRPLELLRVAESSEDNGKNSSAEFDANVIGCIMGAPGTGDSGKENHVDHNGCIMGSSISSKERSLNLNLSIAGGPPPAKQNFRATVSLPIITRHLLAGFCTNSDARDCIKSKMSCVNKEISQCDPQSTNSLQQENDHMDSTCCRQIVQSEDMETLKHKTNEDELRISRGDDQSCLDSEFNEEAPLRNEKAEGRHFSGQGIPSTQAFGTCSDSLMEDPTEIMQKKTRGSGRNDPSPEDSENAANTEKGVDTSSQVRECVATGLYANGAVEDSEMIMSNLLMMVTDEVCNHQLNEDFSGTSVRHHRYASEVSHHESSYIHSSLEANEDVVHKMELQKGVEGSDFQVTKQKVKEVKTTVQLSANNEVDAAAHGLGNNLKQPPQFDQAMEFDPIRQHRHFCPWIMSIGNTSPGWRQTLSALYHQKESSHDILSDTPSSSMLEVDDPIASIRKLFMSPPLKKMKAAHRSS